MTFLTLFQQPANIIYPGDLERKGWLRLVQCPEFVSELRKMNVCIASHHGKIDGYCEKVFYIVNLRL